LLWAESLKLDRLAKLFRRHLGGAEGGFPLQGSFFHCPPSRFSTVMFGGLPVVDMRQLDDKTKHI
jgi:hypothetical protein